MSDHQKHAIADIELTGIRILLNICPIVMIAEGKPRGISFHFASDVIQPPVTQSSKVPVLELLSLGICRTTKPLGQAKI
jgi:hypothetical protein